MKVPIRIMDIDEGEVVAVCLFEESRLDSLDKALHERDMITEIMDGPIPEFNTVSEVLNWLAAD